MCFKVDLRRDTIDYIVSRYGLRRVQEYLIERETSQGPSVLNGFGHPLVPVLGAPEGPAEWMSWGLIPPWVSDEGEMTRLRSRTLNARSETMGSLPSFRDAAKSRRCVVLVTAFVEYRQNDDGSKSPWLVFPGDASSRVMMLGGLWSPWKDQVTFTIITRPALGLCGWVHNTKMRQPVILKEDSLSDWLNPATTDLGPWLRTEDQVRIELINGPTKSPSDPRPREQELFD